MNKDKTIVELLRKNLEWVKICKGLMAATDELMTEFVSNQRAANWGVINDALYVAECAIHSAEKDAYGARVPPPPPPPDTIVMKEGDTRPRKRK